MKTILDRENYGFLAKDIVKIKFKKNESFINCIKIGPPYSITCQKYSKSINTMSLPHPHVSRRKKKRRKTTAEAC